MVESCMEPLKGDLLCKNPLYKVFEQLCGLSVWKQHTYNVKSPPSFFNNLRKIINSLSERHVSDSPCVHVTEGKKSHPFVMLP